LPAALRGGTKCGKIKVYQTTGSRAQLAVKRRSGGRNDHSTPDHQTLYPPCPSQPCPAPAPDRTIERGVTLQADPHLRPGWIWQDDAGSTMTFSCGVKPTSNKLRPTGNPAQCKTMGWSSGTMRPRGASIISNTAIKNQRGRINYPAAPAGSPDPAVRRFNNANVRLKIVGNLHLARPLAWI